MDIVSCLNVNPQSEEIAPNSSILRGLSYHPSDFARWQSLVFACDKDAYDFYCLYAKSCGFSINIGYRAFIGSRRNQKTSYPNYIRYQCYKQGFKKDTPMLEGVVVHKREITRTGCQAYMTLKMNPQEGGYMITKWCDDHNHPLIDADKTHLLRINRVIQPTQKVIIDLYLSAGLSQRSIYEVMCLAAGGCHNLGFTRVDLKNYIQAKRLKEMKPGEAIVLLDWFKDRKSANPEFYYDVQVDKNKQILSIFWADHIMRRDYSLFGDFVSFDTTYRTNKEYRPLGIFVGFNHHKATCIFGGALLFDETADSFKWLFETFLICMNQKMPVTFMTDQAPSIAKGVRCVFSSIFHAICSWHIRQNAKKHLGIRGDGFFSDEFIHLIHHVDTEEEFEYSWDQMLYACFQNRHTSEVSWLQFIYSSRKQWSSAWVKSYFTAGKTTTQLSEQLNSLTRRYLKPSHSVSQFFCRFEALLVVLRKKEVVSDFHMVNRVTKNAFPTSSMMVHAAEIYTLCVFAIFHKEYDAAQALDIMPLPQLKRGSTHVFNVRRREDPQNFKSDLLEEEVVEIDMVSSNLTCSCRFYDNWWVMCRHMLKAMDSLARCGYEFCGRVPEHYIRDRWTRASKKPLATDLLDINGKAQTNYGERCQSLYGALVEAAPRICSNDGAYDLVLKKVTEVVKEADLVIQSNTIHPEPPRDPCAMVGDNIEVIPSLTLKKRRNPCTSKIRLRPEFENRNLKRKQRRKAEMKLLPSVQLAPSS